MKYLLLLSSLAATVLLAILTALVYCAGLVLVAACHVGREAFRHFFFPRKRESVRGWCVEAKPLL